MVCFEPTVPDDALLRAMIGPIVHRGPDDEGIWRDRHVGFGFRRLSIIDLAEGRQPMSNEDGTAWIVFNGEIYNYLELRRELESRGHRFRTRTDTETILHLYEEYGADCVRRLRGMFAFAIWDARRRELFAARDWFGIKPFYYVSEPGRFLFASEIKSLLAAGVPRRLRVESLLKYATFQYVPDPNTMFEGVWKLPPAHAMWVSADGRIEFVRYWDPLFEPEERPLHEYVEELRERLKDSVRAHLVSDVPRGCFLSSGIDSSSIAAVMRGFEPICTFSVGFEGPNNETEIAERIAAAIGTEHYAKVIGRDEFFASVPKAVWHQDEPVADPSAIAIYHLAELARGHVTVVLSGEGADELFGGYRIYREPLAVSPFSRLPAPLLRMLHRLFRLLPKGLYGRNYLLRATTPLEERFFGNARIFTEEAKAELFRVGRELLDRREVSPVETVRSLYVRTKRLDPVSRMQYVDLNLWLPGDILMKADKMTMAHSLELRVPFLDKEIFELARRIPARYRIAEGTTKYVLRKAMEGVVPDFVLNRPKLGFPVPISRWLVGPYGATVFEQIREAGVGDLINLKYVERLWQEHRGQKADHARKLWVVYIFALWHVVFMQEMQSADVFAGRAAAERAATVS